jgi:hypothetical protein
VTQPRLERVEIPPEQIAEALHVLDNAWQLPDRTAVFSGHALRRFRKQITAGHFYRLVFPADATSEHVLEWCRNAEEVLKWRELGLL